MTFESKSPLPTLDKPYPPDLNPFKVGAEWFKSFAAQVESNNVDGVLSTLREDAFWRDTLAMTYDFRTFHGTNEMNKFLLDRLELSDLKQLKFVFAGVDETCPELPWVQGIFTFQIGELGGGNGVFRIIPDSTGEWKVLLPPLRVLGFWLRTKPRHTPSTQTSIHSKITLRRSVLIVMLSQTMASGSRREERKSSLRMKSHTWLWWEEHTAA